MAWFVLLFSVLTLTTSEGVYVWTEWSQQSKCLRSCSKPVGMELFLRKCMNCVGEYCKPVDTLYCGGGNKKVQPCYVGSQCRGAGTFRGEWTSWSSFGVCPPSRGRCKGKYLVSFRRCILPAAYRGRLVLFRCPGFQLVRKVERCPCEVSAWSEWSEWTICSPAGGGQRSRRRVCIRRRYGRCSGGFLQESPCPLGGALPAGGLPRVRKRRSDAQADKIKREYLQVDWEKAPLTNMPPWLIPAGIGGLVAIVFIISLCLVVIKIRRRKKAAKKAKKAKEASANPDELPLLSAGSAPKKGSALSSPTVSDDLSSSDDQGKSGKSGKRKSDKSKKRDATKSKPADKPKSAGPSPAQQKQPPTAPAPQRPAAPTAPAPQRAAAPTAPAPQRAAAPAQQRSPAPAQQRSPAPAPQRSPAPAQQRSPAPAQQRPTAPAQQRSPAPAQQRPTAPAQQRSPPPTHHMTSAAVAAPLRPAGSSQHKPTAPKKPVHQTPPGGAPAPAPAQAPAPAPAQAPAPAATQPTSGQ